MSGRRGPRTPLQPPAEPVVLTLHGFTHGAEAVGRRPDGKVCFVAHALPGERVRVAIETERKRWSRGRLLEVIEPSSDRVAPPCPYARPDACGGCMLQHVRPARQAELLRQVVIDQLERIGHIHDPPVKGTRRPHTAGEQPEDAEEGLGYRTRARFSVDAQGRLGFHRQRTHEVIPIDHCRLLTDGAHGARVEAGDGWRGARSVAVSSGDDGTGLIEVTPGEDPLTDLPEGDRAIVLIDELGHDHVLRGDASVRHMVHGASFQVSATSFFQPSPAGASMLVEEVLEGTKVTPGDRVLDLYSGVGLFSRFLADAGGQVTAYEVHPAAVRDALVNLGSRDVEVVQTDAHEGILRCLAQERRFDSVVLDPPRQGAGQEVCTDMARLAPSRVVYVACDPAALARDAKMLVGLGYRLVRVVPIDQFTHTGHIEAVATFHRG